MLYGIVLGDKTGGQRRKGDIETNGICLHDKMRHMMSLAFLGLVEQVPADGKHSMYSLFCCVFACGFCFTH